eukprot:gene9844-7047_t
MASSSSAGRAFSDSDALTPLLFQLFAAHGCLLDDSLAAHLATATQRSWSSEQLRLLFVAANANLRPMGFEVRTVMMRGAVPPTSSSTTASASASAVTRVHCLVNIEEDHVAREAGSVFAVDELKLFTATLQRLLWRRKMTTADVVEVCLDNAPPGERRKQTFLQELVGRWEQAQWLTRTEANLLEIGPRTHLELRQLLETFAESPTEEDEAAGRDAAAVAQSLPQIIIH